MQLDDSDLCLLIASWHMRCLHFRSPAALPIDRLKLFIFKHRHAPSLSNQEERISRSKAARKRFRHFFLCSPVTFELLFVKANLGLSLVLRVQSIGSISNSRGSTLLRLALIKKIFHGKLFISEDWLIA
jgi:hypothetical protein